MVQADLVEVEGAAVAVAATGGAAAGAVAVGMEASAELVEAAEAVEKARRAWQTRGGRLLLRRVHFLVRLQ